MSRMDRIRILIETVGKTGYPDLGNGKKMGEIKETHAQVSVRDALHVCGMQFKAADHWATSTAGTPLVRFKKLMRYL